MMPTAARAAIRSPAVLAVAAFRGRVGGQFTQRVAYSTGPADPKIQANDHGSPEDDAGEAAVKGAEAEELQVQRLRRQGGVKEVEPPSTVNTQSPGKPFASSLRLESSEVGERPDPMGQQKKPF